MVLNFWSTIKLNGKKLNVIILTTIKDN